MALVPATGAVQAATSTTGDLRVIHGIPGGPEVDVDVWVNGLEAASDLASGESFDVGLSAGDHDVVVCFAGSTDDTCAPGGAAQTVLSGVISVAGGTTYTLVVEPNVAGPPPPVGTLAQFVVDTTPTGLGMARFQFNHAIPAGVGPVSVCLDGEAVAGLEEITFPNAGIAEVPEGVYGLSLDLGLGCDPETNDVNLVAGTSFALTATAVETCGANCVQVLVVGQERPDNMPDPAFCNDVLGLSEATILLDALFAGVVVGEPGTYPTPDEVMDVVDALNAVILLGDIDVPLEVQPQWEILTAGLRDLAAGLALVGGDLEMLPEAALQDIIDGLNDDTPDPEIDAATEVLTEWVVANCFDTPAPTPTPTPTPAPTPAPAQPTSVTPRFTG
nr:DUF4397 domain-containing protein [Rhabdothermincola salaria]